MAALGRESSCPHWLSSHGSPHSYSASRSPRPRPLAALIAAAVLSERFETLKRRPKNLDFESGHDQDENPGPLILRVRPAGIPDLAELQIRHCRDEGFQVAPPNRRRIHANRVRLITCASVETKGIEPSTSWL